MLLGPYHVRVFERATMGVPAPDPSIRPATVGDLRAVGSLLAPGVDHARRLAAGNVCLVKWRGDEPVGLYWVNLHGRTDPHYGLWSQATPQTAYLNQLQVAHRHRGRGHGTALAAQACVTAAAHGRSRVRCLVDPTNPPSVAVHTTAGFEAGRDMLGMRVGHHLTLRLNRHSWWFRDTERRRRILVVINRLGDTGGAEVSTALPISRLQGQEFDFGVVTLFEAADPTLRPDFEARGVRFWSSDPGLLSQLRTIDEAIREFEPDLMHATLFDAELAGRLVAKVRRVPVLASIVNMQYSPAAVSSSPSPRKLAIIRELDGFLARHATTHFMAITEAASKSAQEALHIDPNTIDVVHRGRDRAVLGAWTIQRRQRMREQLGIEESTPLVLNVARQEPQKDQSSLLRAFRLVVDEIPAARLIVAGRQGASTTRLLAQRQELGLDAAVTFLGARTDVPELLCAADAFAFTSKYEGLGGAILEAMALRVPIIAFDIAPVREVVDDTAALVPPGDIAGFSAEVVRMIQDRDHASALSNAALERFDQCYEAQRYVRALAQLYRRLT